MAITKLVYLKRLREKEIPAGAYRVLVEVFNYANASGGNAHPGEQLLAKVSCMSVRTVRDHLSWLTENGYLIKGRRGHGGGMATVYAVGLDHVPMSEIPTGENSPEATGEDPWATGKSA